MPVNAFWEYTLSLESRYADYRKRIMKAFSLSAAEVDILLFLANNPGFDTAAQIARIRKIPKSQVSMSVASLCEKGLLTGAHEKGDKKSVHLSLSPLALPVVTFGREVPEEFAALRFKGFSDEEKEPLLALHKKIEQNLRSGLAGGPPNEGPAKNERKE